MTLPYEPLPFAGLHQRPGVVTWFNVYSLLMGLMYVICTVAGVLLLVYEPDTGPDSEARFLGVLLAIMGPLLAIPFLAAPFLPRKKWVWVYDLVLIAIGLTGCTFAASIPLLIFWLQPRTKEWFGMKP